MTDMALEVISPAYTLADAGKRHNELVKFVSELMVEGVDYGVIPGSQKPSLLKPGAEKLASFFNLVPRFTELVTEEDWTGERHKGEPFFFYKFLCQLYKGERIISECIASINSWEKKYRWRKGERVCPVCGKETIIKGKKEYGGGWLCWDKKGGCGEKFLDDDARITSQNVEAVPNKEIFDQVNTMAKMGQKRALIGAVLIGVNASELFTQDLDEVVIEGSWSNAPADKVEKKSEPQQAKSYTKDQIGPEFDEPPLLDEHGNPVVAKPVQTQPVTARKDVDVKTGEVISPKPVAKVEPKKPEVKAGEPAISAEFVEGALEYRTENGVKMVKWGVGWKPAEEVSGKNLKPATMDALLALFPYENGPMKGKPNQFEAGSHLKKHFKGVKMWTSLTWEQLAGVFAWKKLGIPDERWYREEYAEWKQETEAANQAAVQSPAPVPVEHKEPEASTQTTPLREFYKIPANHVELGIPNEDVQSFVENMAKQPNPYSLEVLMDGGLDPSKPDDFNQFVSVAQLLAEGMNDEDLQATIGYILENHKEAKA